MIDRESKLPFYYQLSELLRSQIMSGELAPGDMLPTENELIKRYHLSRATVRQALDLLVQDGLIYRQRGRGTFVARPTIEQTLSRIISFTEDMQQRGLVPQTIVLASELVPAGEEIARMLEIEPGEELAHLKRLRLADGEPMSVENAFLVHRCCPGVLNRDYARTPLRETLEREYGIRLAYARQKIRAVSATRDLADLLGVASGAALLCIERVTLDDKGTPVEFLRIHHRGDRYILYNELRA
ncbi:MAG: transcriptional regulator NagR [Anaerolineae bacterium]